MTKTIRETHNIRIDEKLDKEQVTERLSLVWEGAKDAGRTTIEDSWKTLCGECGTVRGDLLMILSIDEHGSHKSTEDLSEDIVRHFPPWEALPGRKC